MGFTVAYNEPTQGWSSFFSYIPEYMVGINNSFYSFKGGQIYLHNSLTVPPCNYYNVQYPAEVTFLVNEKPLERKLFKAIALESSSPWVATSILPDEAGQNGGQITTSQYELKEGMYFSNIRYSAGYNASPNYKNRSTTGVGQTSVAITGTGSSRTYTFSANISNSISVGDRVYYGAVSGTNVSSPIQGGKITAITSNTIVTDLTGTPPAVGTTGRYVFVVKDATVESYGVGGSYMEVTLQESTNNQSELFSVEIDYMKSFP
jgi:hypothetical protein